MSTSTMTLPTGRFRPRTLTVLTSCAHRLIASHVCVRSFAQAATAQQPSSSSTSPSAPSTSLTPHVSSTATLPNSKLWRFRPTHRRFPLSKRYNPATPMRFRPITAPTTTSTTTTSASQPQPPQPVQPTRVPFTISRTRSHALPVYLDYRGGGTLVTTCVRRVEGDAEMMARQLQLLVGDRTRVVVRPGRVEVKGNYLEETKKWLETIGF